jgi:tetratricopeptide (TPR) repeat protein
VNQVRVVLYFFVTLVVLPPACSARQKAHLTSPDNNDSVISARELSIPEKASKAFNKGTQLLAAKDWVRGIFEFQLAIRVFPNFYEAYYRMGIADAQLGREPDAELAFRKSIALSDGRYAPPHFGLGMILADEKQEFAEAENLVRTGLSLGPSDAAGYFTLAWILYSTGRLPDAEKSARQATVYEPDLAAAHLLLDQIRIRMANQSASGEDTSTVVAQANP